MAKVNRITPETIELMRGKIDFYLLRGILPVARRWPKKPKPPYTPLQAEGMAVFSLANRSMHFLTQNMIDEWRKGSQGISPSWTDTYRKIIMSYWKLNKGIPAIATDFNINENELTYQVVWDIIQLSIPPDTTETIYQLQTEIINKTELEMATLPIYFTLYDDDKVRQVAPFILFKDRV